MIFPPPTHTYTEELSQTKEGPSNEWVKWYLDVPSWKCSCGVTNFGRNVRCARPTCKKEKQ